MFPTRWVFNLRPNEVDNLFHFDTRYNSKDGNVTMLNHLLGGVKGRSGAQRLTVSGQDYPFLPDRTFRFTVQANSSTEVHFYTSYTLPLPLTNVTFVNFKFQVQVLYLDLWCSAP
ncbi:hypothetical protein ACOMHN_022835 [Nucella lapillus]